MNRVVSIKIYTNGLFGQPFAIGAVVYENEEVIEYWGARCPIRGKAEIHVRQDILPKINNLRFTHRSYGKMLADFACFYMENCTSFDTVTVIYNNYDALARLLFDMHYKRVVNHPCDLPSRLVHLEDILLAESNFNSTTITPSSYNEQNGILVPCLKDNKYNPVFISKANALCFMHTAKKRH